MIVHGNNYCKQFPPLAVEEVDQAEMHSLRGRLYAQVTESLVDPYPYMLVSVGIDEFRLVSIDDGNRWSDSNVTKAELMNLWRDVTHMYMVVRKEAG